jgi:hypothetical protein
MAVRSEATPHTRPRRIPGALGGAPVEIAGYVLIALGLTVLLLLRVRHVDAFYLDEWLYTQGGEYMWDNLPLGPIEQIPHWTRGPQRLYTWLLALSWGPLGTSTAFTVSHVMNVVLLVSAVWPAALIARCVVASPWLRVLAVALAVAIPWLLISANLLTENLAFPVFLWTCVAIIEAGRNPRPATQLAAVAGVVALALCRLNLAVMFVALLVVVIGTELRRLRGEPAPAEGRLRAALRRQRVVAVATVAAAAGGLWIFLSGGSSLGAYGAFTDASILDAVWGYKADDTGRAILTYLRSVATGSFVFPLLLGLAVSFAGVRGRLGDRLFVPALTALASLVAVIVAISVWNVAFGALEERYAFYVYSPLAILAVAGLEQLRRIVPELVAAGALITLAIGVGLQFPGVNSGHFFAAPAGAFWTRVVDHRLQRAELDYLDWLPGAGEGWLIVALGMAAAIGIALVVAHRGWPSVPLLAGGLALCVVAQVAVLNYDYDKLLYGTPEVPSGLAASPDRSLDRDDWVDEALPDNAEATIVPALTNPAIPYGDAERQEFWNESLTGIVALRFVGAPVPAEPGLDVVESELGPDGLAAWRGPRSEWLVAQPDDPRIQFAGRPVAESRSSPFAVVRVEGSPRAIWTADGLEADGALLARRPATLTLDRAHANGVRSISLHLRGVENAPGAVSWRLEPVGGGTARSGRLRPGGERTVTVPVPSCESACEPVAWRLTARGTPTPQPPPFFGELPRARPVMLHLLSARLER